jgi:hypothetical protein
MTAAILIYGMYREFDNCIDKWVDIEKYYECDYYFSTWNKSTQKYSNSDLIKEFDVTPNMITDYLPNCVYDILDEDTIFPIKPQYPSSNMLLFHWKNVYRLMLESKKNYDMVILIRSDSILAINKLIDMDINEWINKHPNDLFGRDIRLVETNPYKFISEDTMFMGSMDVMGKWINMIPDVTNISLKIHSHFWLTETFLSLDLIPNSHYPFTAGYVRPKL